MIKGIKKLAAYFTFVAAVTASQTAFADDWGIAPSELEVQAVAHLSTDQGNKNIKQTDGKILDVQKLRDRGRITYIIARNFTQNANLSEIPQFSIEVEQDRLAAVTKAAEQYDLVIFDFNGAAANRTMPVFELDREFFDDNEIERDDGRRFLVLESIAFFNTKAVKELKKAGGFAVLRPS